MDSTIGNFRLEIKYRNLSALVFITDMRTWKLLSCSPDSDWPQQKTWRSGTWTKIGQVVHCYAYGTGIDAASENNQTQVEVFRLTDVEFPPEISSRAGFWVKQFFISNAWANNIGVQTGIVKAPPGSAHKLTMPTHGSWNPIITGPLIKATEEKLKQFYEELKQLLIQAGLDVASMIDPTGAFSIPAAGYAMSRGDYLGCCANLLGVIPLFGRATSAAKAAAVSAKLAFLTKEVTFIEEWLKISVNATRRLRQSEAASGLLNVEVQGTTRATMVAKTATALHAATEGLKNLGWVRKIYNADHLGLLPEELRVLRSLAKEGYYFVVRSCNPSRVQWLRSASKHGWGMIGKPVWLKIKSLKDTKFAGLVGFKKMDVEFFQTIERLQQVKELPGSVKLGWLAEKGVSPSNIKVYRLNKDFHRVPHVEDAEMMVSHYFVDTGDSYVIVDRLGRPYVPDLDIVSIQKAVGQGRFGPPGYNLANTKSALRGSDSAEMSAFWNSRFAGTVHYPPGYQPFGWHGGGGGSAAYFGKVPKGYDPALHVRPLGWNPEKPAEDLIVACKNIEGLGDDVGYVTGWDKLAQFHRANSGMGEFRFDVH